MSTRTKGFNVRAFLESAGLAKKLVAFRRAEIVFSQGDPCDRVMYIQEGSVKLSALSKAGRDVVVAILGPGDFFGEGCLAGQKTRITSATSLTASTIRVIKNSQMLKVLHQERGLSDRFIAHMVSRHVGSERDLVGQFFDSDEKHLAQVLLSLARYGTVHEPIRVLSKISRETLSEMIGASRARVAVFMNKFRKLGFIEFSNALAGTITINSALLNVVLYE